MLQARATLADARRAIDDLRQAHPWMIWIQLLNLEISRFTEATGIPCDFHSDPSPSLPEPLKRPCSALWQKPSPISANHAQAQHVKINTRK